MQLSGLFIISLVTIEILLLIHKYLKYCRLFNTSILWQYFLEAFLFIAMNKPCHVAGNTT